MRCGRCSSAAFQVTLEWDLIAGHHYVATWTGFISSLSVVVFLVQLKPDPLLRLPQYLTGYPSSARLVVRWLKPWDSNSRLMN